MILVTGGTARRSSVAQLSGHGSPEGWLQLRKVGAAFPSTFSV